MKLSDLPRHTGWERLVISRALLGLNEFKFLLTQKNSKSKLGKMCNDLKTYTILPFICKWKLYVLSLGLHIIQSRTCLLYSLICLMRPSSIRWRGEWWWALGYGLKTVGLLQYCVVWSVCVSALLLCAAFIWLIKFTALLKALEPNRGLCKKPHSI